MTRGESQVWRYVRTAHGGFGGRSGRVQLALQWGIWQSRRRAYVMAITISGIADPVAGAHEAAN
jgi:hypothetical protein